MTITSVTEDWRQRKSEESLQDGITGSRAITCYSDTTNELESVVYAACPITLGSSFPGTITCYCMSRHAEISQEDRTVWTVYCQYKSILSKVEQDRITNPDPLDRSTKINWSSRTINYTPTRMLQAFGPTITYPSTATYRAEAYSTFTTDWAFDGQLYSVTNAARDVYDPAPEMPSTEWIANCTKNISVAPTWITTYNDAVNDADFIIDGIIVLKGCAKLEGLRLGEQMKENGTAYRQLSFNIVIRKPRDKVGSESVVPEPWDLELLNQGMRENISGKWRNISFNGVDVHKPVLLTAAGVSVNYTGDPIPLSSVTWLLYRPFARKSFSVLPLV